MLFKKKGKERTMVEVADDIIHELENYTGQKVARNERKLVALCRESCQIMDRYERKLNDLTILTEELLRKQDLLLQEVI